MSVERIRAELGQVLSALDLAPLERALDLIGQAERTFTHATQGSHRPEAEQALGLLDQTKQQLRQLYGHLTAARTMIDQYLANLAGGEASPPTGATSATAGRPTASASVGTKLTREQADAIRAGLPPQVPTPNPEGKKTHGTWLGGSGAEAHMVSGRDEDAAEAWRLLQAAGMPVTTPPASVTHVEMKAATRAVRSAHRGRHQQHSLRSPPIQL